MRFKSIGRLFPHSLNDFCMHVGEYFHFITIYKSMPHFQRWIVLFYILIFFCPVLHSHFMAVHSNVCKMKVKFKIKKTHQNLYESEKFWLWNVRFVYGFIHKSRKTIQHRRHHFPFWYFMVTKACDKFSKICVIKNKQNKQTHAREFREHSHVHSIILSQ